ncbi:class I SAM-dependent methyltransferase [Novosphingobium sp.]|uniref:class I SAM-dependent methyltransferase n=1 Tax=Novosphingobium sp. TaxID=1874826 RepID=UPI0025E284AF|nr:class I SAM-dependent methyltransferase [Novosphingobium sp.]
MPARLPEPSQPRATRRLEHLRKLARRVPFAMNLGRWLHRWLDPDLRAIERLRRQAPAGLLQPFPDTFDDRYPELFAALAHRLRGIERPRVLSFGCSDGAELRSLRRYLPHAELVGIDLNPRALGRAQAHLAAHPDALMRYHLAGDTRDEPRESFDAILALAVLRHGELEAGRPVDCADILPFAQATAALADLDARLKPGGWLAVWHAHYRVRDAAATAAYPAETLPFSQADPLDLLYGSDNLRLEGVTSAEVLFRKPA